MRGRGPGLFFHRRSGADGLAAVFGLFGRYLACILSLYSDRAYMHSLKGPGVVQGMRRT